VVTADFNNDGHLDLATANPAAGTVSVLLGDGRGGFGAAIDSRGSGFNHASLAVADFDNDGNLDLAVVSAYYDRDPYGYWPEGSLSVLLGNGDGTFQAPTYPRYLGVPVSAAAGDFNNDGNSDLVVTEDNLDSYGFVEVLLGNGQGGFTRAPWALIPHPQTAVTVADLNRDGNLDAVTAATPLSGSSGFALLGNGDGTFRDRFSEFGVFGNDDRGLAVGDFTGDGIPDWVTAGRTVNVWRGLGDGTYAYPPIPQSANGNVHTGVVVADFNGGGKLDAVTADADTGTVSLLLGNGDGTLWYAGAFAAGASPTAVVVGDFNEDGRPDAATANAGPNTVSVLLNDGVWPATTPQLRIGDVTLTEGNTGTVEAVFTVTRSGGLDQLVTVQYATADVGATAGIDYHAAAGTLTFAPGETSKTIAVLVNGDRIPEHDEVFFVNLSEPTNAVLARDRGWGIIRDDEPRIRISDVTKAEGRRGTTTLFTFTVTLLAAYDQPVTVSYRTADGTATASDGDYVAQTGTLAFAPGETTQTITIEVKGDSKREANEYFYLDLFDDSGTSLFTKSRGRGTILNDD
jgi:hypothetical protein